MEGLPTRSILALALVALLLVVGASEGASDSREVVLASEILAKIERGEPVEYDDVIVEGDLDLNGLDLPTEHVDRTESEIKWLGLTEEVKVVKSSITITHSEIRGAVDFCKTIFRESVDFRGTDFSGDVNFRMAQFSGDVNFRMAQFSGDVYFPWAQFSGDAYFDGAQFSGDAYFWEAQFSGDANFRVAQFSGDAYFGGAQFSGDADFGGAQFSGVADFREAQFSGDASFDGAQFSGDTYLLELTFTQLLFIEWNSIAKPICDDATYLKLIRNFRDTGQFKSADDCYYDYRTWRMEREFPSWSTPIDLLAWFTCGYGVRPRYTLYWSFGIIFFFGLTFWTGNGIYRSATPQKEEAYEKTWAISPICSLSFKKISNIFRRILRIPVAVLKTIIYLPKIILTILFKLRPSKLLRAIKNIREMSFTTNVSLKDSLYFSSLVFVSQPPHDWRPKDDWKYAVMIEDILGWLLLALFLVTLGNVMIR